MLCGHGEKVRGVRARSARISHSLTPEDSLVSLTQLSSFSLFRISRTIIPLECSGNTNLRSNTGTNGKLGTGDMNIRVSDVPLRVKRKVEPSGGFEDLFLGRSRRGIDRRDVSIYANHCAALTTDGRLYMWGCFRSGRTTHNDHECSAKIVSALSTEKTSSDLSSGAREGRRGGMNSTDGGDGDDVSTKVDESGVSSDSRSSGGNDTSSGGGDSSQQQMGGGTGGMSSASQRASDKRHKTLTRVDKMSNLDELAMIAQRWAKEEVPRIVRESSRNSVEPTRMILRRCIWRSHDVRRFVML